MSKALGGGLRRRPLPEPSRAPPVLDHAGGGMDLLFAALRVGPTWRAIGVDMAPVMVETAIEGARQVGLTGVQDFWSEGTAGETAGQ